MRFFCVLVISTRFLSAIPPCLSSSLCKDKQTNRQTDKQTNRQTDKDKKTNTKDRDNDNKAKTTRQRQKKNSFAYLVFFFSCLPPLSSLLPPQISTKKVPWQRLYNHTPNVPNQPLKPSQTHKDWALRATRVKKEVKNTISPCWAFFSRTDCVGPTSKIRSSHSQYFNKG